MKKILITGITGQDGSYLAEQCLADGDLVYGVIRRSSSFNTARIDHIFQHPNLKIVFGDLTDAAMILGLVAKIQPDAIYNLGAQSHVRVSFDIPGYTLDSIARGTLNLLEAVRQVCPTARFYQASSSEQFGDVLQTPQTETTPFNPQSPYACAKVCAHHLTAHYRKAFGLHASCGILFNHESPRRGETFVTRKITKAAARIALGKQDVLELGNLGSKRDWGFAPEYTQAMRLMIGAEQPDDYVIATGQTHTVEEFLTEVFNFFNLSITKHVRFNERLLRPAEVDLLLGDPTKAEVKLGWKPKVKFADLARIMSEADDATETAKC